MRANIEEYMAVEEAALKFVKSVAEGIQPEFQHYKKIRI